MHWEYISTDFITKLPLVNGHDAILLVVDRYTKMSQFIHCPGSMSSEMLIHLLFMEIFRIHGFSNILFDRAPAHQIF